MTILSKKKKGGNAVKSDETGGQAAALPHAHNHQHQQQRLSPSDGLNVERQLGERSNPSSSGLGRNHEQSLPHGHSNDQRSREEKRPVPGSQSQCNEGEHVQTGVTHGKRHRSSQLQCTRSKHSRVDHEISRLPPTSSTAGITSNERKSPICMVPPAPAPASNSDNNACNSEDEYEAGQYSQLPEEEKVEKEKRFEKKMKKKGFVIKNMGEDGACLFRSVADQVYGDQEMHAVVRKLCMDYIQSNSDYFSQYITEDFDRYVQRKRLDFVHGNHVEIQAMSEMYNRTIEVFCYRTEPINSFQGAHQTDNEPIRLSYHRGCHYNSLVDPTKATIGVGLGLPGHVPGLADMNLVKEAVRQSEDYEIEQAMLEDKLRASDWEATNEEIEEQVARDSYLQWLKDNERRNRKSPITSRSSATVTDSSSSCSGMRSPRSRSHGGSNIVSQFHEETMSKKSPSRLSPPPSVPGNDRTKNNPVSASHSKMNEIEWAKNYFQSPNHTSQEMPSAGVNTWDDGILAEVLAASQREYLDNLKKTRGASSCSPTKDCKESDN